MNRLCRWIIFTFFLFSFANNIQSQYANEDDDSEVNSCNGIFLSYDFVSRIKGYPRVKNATAQSWAFNSTATVLNTGTNELKAWKIFVGFQHQEILVSVGGGVAVDDDNLPAAVGNGTYFSGYPQTDLKTSIDTAGDLDQIQAKLQIKGTQFGVKPSGVPMPKTIKLVNDGYECPAPKINKTSMRVCCKRNPKIKVKETILKYLPRQDGDLLISYDVMQAYQENYVAQVTMENNHPLGRLDHWNLTWEWMRGEFINTMRGAYTHEKDFSDCIYGPAAEYYKSMDFSKVMNCQKHPIIADLPPDRAKDEQIGNLPYCCKNGSLLPTTMNETKSKAVFQVQVFKIPPDLNITTIYPPQKWKVVGILNPDYKCGPPRRVDNAKFPDTSGLDATISAIASWQVVCNITKPKSGNSGCCVSFSAYYNESVIPCDTCACGCKDTEQCNPNAEAMLLPPEALLVPFVNRTAKAKAWARMQHFEIPRPLPCSDNCGVSINWHINADYSSGWTARMTILNWKQLNFEDWFAAIQIPKAYPGYAEVYSFNGTKVSSSNNTILFQGLKGSNYLMGITNSSKPEKEPMVPGKQQSVILFRKKLTRDINVKRGDGFPTKVYFNGEECTLPLRLPSSGEYRFHVNVVQVIALAVMNFLLLTL
ncbi:COBRA, plant [Dillenia turbinata]|uniref:COBRA, plant n=1 Tax=Dillenia turbinata TaxID=194707 RepID=A0AAN8VCJ8_9MAGN